MWLFLPDAFLSIVSKDCKPDELMVRARVATDINRVFPDAKVTESDLTDYPFRAKVKRVAVAAAIEAHVMAMGYPNFKGAVKNTARHNAYSSVWGAMLRLQSVRRRAEKASSDPRRNPALKMAAWRDRG